MDKRTSAPCFSLAINARWRAIRAPFVESNKAEKLKLKLLKFNLKRPAIKLKCHEAETRKVIFFHVRFDEFRSPLQKAIRTDASLHWNRYNFPMSKCIRVTISRIRSTSYSLLEAMCFYVDDVIEVVTWRRRHHHQPFDSSYHEAEEIVWSHQRGWERECQTRRNQSTLNDILIALLVRIYNLSGSNWYCETSRAPRNRKNGTRWRRKNMETQSMIRVKSRK